MSWIDDEDDIEVVISTLTNRQGMPSWNPMWLPVWCHRYEYNDEDEVEISPHLDRMLSVRGRAWFYYRVRPSQMHIAVERHRNDVFPITDIQDLIEDYIKENIGIWNALKYRDRRDGKPQPATLTDWVAIYGSNTS